MARPRKEWTDKEIKQLETLAKCHCPDHEIAAFMGCGERTIQRRFGALLKRSRDAGRANLRATQYQLAMAGNTALLIWLGKQILGQREPRFELDVTQVKPFVVETSLGKTVMGITDGSKPVIDVN